ncbi:prefoldin subunit alpha [Methanobrevibacter sp. OttesenSCG-928-K11]|nr:prefoldin subunit alpha [Methanobrevibacter sp. OttesenSCG-928-K11]MDL2270228.1 prefoldin subunit alpha [Methanobrevibacter sp. OttesenSCG-928-I08]
MEDQQRLEEMVNEINMYNQQAELIQQQIEMIRSSLTEVEVLDSTLEDLKEKDSVEAFIPIGAGSFMKGEINKTDEVIMSVGSGVAISKNLEGAKETLSTQKKELEDNLDKMLANLQQVSDILGKLSPQAEQLANKLQTQQIQ